MVGAPVPLDFVSARQCDRQSVGKRLGTPCAWGGVVVFEAEVINQAVLVRVRKLGREDRNEQHVHV